MSMQAIADALRRIETALERRPGIGLHDDSPATARWEGGTRVVARGEHGAEFVTDMPRELGGDGAHVSPGWLMRAGLAACAATRIAMAAAAQGIELATLEVVAASRSDARGLFGMVDGEGTPVGAGPTEIVLDVRIGAPGVAATRLHALVEDTRRLSPVTTALTCAVPVTFRVAVSED